jgi:hypothetical protein
MTTATKLATCAICGHQEHWLGDHIVEVHGMSVSEYLEAYPNSELESNELTSLFTKTLDRKRRVAAGGVEDLYVELGGFRWKVNHDVPEDACLPMPYEYRLPKSGALGKDVLRALRYIYSGRSTYIWGLPGAGKDALPHALCAMTRTPSAIYQVSPEVDIMAWFFTRAFDATSTKWEEGMLLKQLRDGYTTSTGRKIPYTIILSDFDRAGKAQAESIRLVTDSIQGRIVGPTGESYKVFPGTRIVITANTMGGGDERGRMVSSNLIDGSILNRIERKVYFSSLNWTDEEPIIRAKFPLFVQHCESLLPSIGNCVQALRKAVEDGELYGEFSHRDLCNWIGDAEDIIRIQGSAPPNILKMAFECYADGMPDKENQLAASRLVDPHLKGGALNHGKTSATSEELDT